MNQPAVEQVVQVPFVKEKTPEAHDRQLVALPEQDAQSEEHATQLAPLMKTAPELQGEQVFVAVR